MLKEFIDALKSTFGAPIAGRLIVAALSIFALWQVYLYVDSVTRESKKPFLQAQLDFCKDVVSHIEIVATAENAQDQESAIGQFWRYYHGRLVLVENDALEKAMVDFAQAIDHPTTREYAPLTFQRAITRPINQAALGVSRACRDLLKWNWK